MTVAMREVRAIYHQGVWAVAAAFRQLYEVIEVEGERVHRRVAAATAAHLHKTERLTGRIAKLEEEPAVKARQVHRPELTVRELNKELKGARAQTRQARERHLAHLRKDSRNSSLPPSQDRRKRARSLRERSGRRPGGQVGHPGTTLGFARQPDRLIIHAPQSCHLCGSSLVESQVARTERRQVHDLPPQKVEVTEHQAQTKVCRRYAAEIEGAKRLYGALQRKGRAKKPRAAGHPILPLSRKRRQGGVAAASSNSTYGFQMELSDSPSFALARSTPGFDTCQLRHERFVMAAARKNRLGVTAVTA